MADILAQGETLQLDCPICYEAIRPDTLVLSQCIHWYCIDCYESVAKRQKSCSICRTPFVKNTHSPSLYQVALDLVQTVDRTSGEQQRVATTALFRYLESHPELFYQNMLLQKIVLEKLEESIEKAGQAGDIELLAACTDTRRVIYEIITA